MNTKFRKNDILVNNTDACLMTSPPFDSKIGVTLVLLGALTSAVQMIVEEIYMQQYGYHPLQAVGAEGVYGTLIVGLVS